MGSNDVTIVSHGSDANAHFKTRLNRREELKIRVAVQDHCYLLSNGRNVYDLRGAQIALGLNPEGFELIFEDCPMAEKVSISGKWFIYKSYITRLAYQRVEQPHDALKSEKLRHGRNLLMGKLSDE